MGGGSGAMRIAVGKGGIAQGGGTQTLPADGFGSRRLPCGFHGGSLWRVGIDLKQQLRTAPEGLGERPLTLSREGADISEQLFRHLDLGLRHAIERAVPSN